MPAEREVERWFEQQVSTRLLVGLGGRRWKSTRRASLRSLEGYRTA